MYVKALIDEYDEISSADVKVLYPDLDGKYAFEARRARMSFLSFMILKVSPFLSKKWDQKQTVVHEGLENLGPQLVIANYGAKVDNNEVKVVNPVPLPDPTPALQSVEPKIDSTTEEDPHTF